jgi:hypothetical protein
MDWYFVHAITLTYEWNLYQITMANRLATVQLGVDPWKRIVSLQRALPWFQYMCV